MFATILIAIIIVLSVFHGNWGIKKIMRELKNKNKIDSPKL